MAWKYPVILKKKEEKKGKRRKRTKKRDFFEIVLRVFSTASTFDIATTATCAKEKDEEEFRLELKPHLESLRLTSFAASVLETTLRRASVDVILRGALDSFA